MNEPVPGQAAEETAPGDWSSAELGAIYDENCRAIFYLTLRYLGDPQQAEDATHDIFLKAFQRLGKFRGEASVRTWLYRIAINHCHNLSRSWHHRHVYSNADEAVFETAVSRSDSPFRVLETKELGQRIQKALDALAPDYRLLLLLVADEELSYEEIASVVDQSVDAVRGKLHRARKAFAIQFQKTG